MSFAVERFYETAALGDGWPSLLEDMSQYLGVAGITFISLDGNGSTNLCSPGIADKNARYFQEGWHLKNDRIDTLLSLEHLGFIRDIDVHTPEELAQIPVVRDFFRPIGHGWGGACATQIPGGEILVFSIEQFFDRGPLSDAVMAELERMRPHINRAALLTAKIRHQRAAATVEAFDIIDTPAALVRTNGTVLAANATFARLEGQISIGASNRMRVGSAVTATQLENALRHPFASRAVRPPLSIAVPARGEHVPLVLHIMPTRGEARQIFGDETALLLVTRLVGKPVPPTGLLRALFDLTPAEARVASAMLEGRSSREMAGDFAIGSETVKTQVNAVLQKSGFRRRIDFVRFVSGIAAPTQPE